MCFKGEIYNRKDFCFQGSDAEVARKVYEKWGLDGFARLRGEFAFVFDDGCKTIAVRDHFGTVPFYYYMDSVNNTLLCDVSVKSLLARGVPRVICKQGLATFLAYGCLMHPWTMVDGVMTVLPGCCIIYDRETGMLSQHEYWRPDFKVKKWHMGDLQDTITTLLLRSVERQLDKGGNPAAFLSGGIDSSAIVALMRKLDSRGEIRTYCITSGNEKLDERKWARMVAVRNDTKHKELLITGNEICAHIDEAIASYDQPSVDGLNFWFGCRSLRDVGENLMLSGEAGDELFFSAMGKQVFAHRADKYVRWMPRWCGGLVEKVAWNEKIRKMGQLMGAAVPTFFITRRIISSMRIQKLLKDRFLDLSGLEKPHIDIKRNETDIYNYISWMDIRNFGADMYLRDCYQVGNYHGVNMRMPLYDVDLAEVLYSVAGDVKYSIDNPKYLLVNACRAGIPFECIKRPKAGFALPFSDCLKDGMMMRLQRFFNSDDSILFDSSALRKLGKLFFSGKVYWSNIWIPFMAENWCRNNDMKI